MTNQINVPFQGSSLTIVNVNGQPYTPMKPIVRGMGLSWEPQQRKIRNNALRWGMIKMILPSNGGEQETFCIPLRKLFAWLQTISANKVRTDLKEKVIAYQNECDDVLWEYWTKSQTKEPKQLSLPVQQAPYSTRVMLVIENGQVTDSRPIPDDAFIVTKNRLCSLINEPGIFSTNELSDIACTASQKLAAIAGKH